MTSIPADILKSLGFSSYEYIGIVDGRDIFRVYNGPKLKPNTDSYTGFPNLIAFEGDVEYKMNGSEYLKALKLYCGKE